MDELKAVNRIMDRICRVRETNHIMSVIIDELAALTGATQGVVNLVSREAGADLVTVVRKRQAEAVEMPFKVHSLVTGWVLAHNTMLKIDDLDSDSRFAGLSSESGSFKSMVCFPMVVRGETIGLTSLVRDAAAGPFQDEQCRVAGIVVSQSAQILSNAILLEELARKNDLLELSQRKLRDDNIRLQVELQAGFAFESVIGKSAAMKTVLVLASKVSENDSPVLISGPTGTGKEVLARAIHFNSKRKDKQFVVKNCGIRTESLMEAELFGYVKGAFTGAERDKRGLFREADGGTIFLDEVGDAPLSTQVAILRVIETGEIRPVGATKTEFVNVRVISATNRDLRQEITKGTFREDLFYRLNTFTIDLPPLAQRRDDIPLLVDHFLKKLRIKLSRADLVITPAALQMLNHYSWPGNIRQLENEIERSAVVCGAEGIIDVSDLSREVVSAAVQQVASHESRGDLKAVVEQVERKMISAALAKNKGNILRTAKMLGLTRKGLKDKMARYGIGSDGIAD
ncbi:MAG TPA: sigma-54-dependent Fis family transcriptional regulator [Candidatus Deferrimicrobium sp.]|nr:sigma-54-dependent Fis family transcriptional regulator [Candidatus Deferrimicrobium sp.]